MTDALAVGATPVRRVPARLTGLLLLLLLVVVAAGASLAIGTRSIGLG